MLPRETGSNQPEHDRGDRFCSQTVTTVASSRDNTCPVCAASAESVTREQAAAAINHREIGS